MREVKIDTIEISPVDNGYVLTVRYSDFGRKVFVTDKEGLWKQIQDILHNVKDI